VAKTGQGGKTTRVKTESRRGIHKQFRVYFAAVPPLAGKFIVFDGNEGSGKSTQAKLLQERLAREGRGPVVEFVRDPGTTRIGEQIRAILLNPDNDEMVMRTEMFLYMSARAQMMAERIRPALEAGKLVLSDRFVSSTLAYQLGGDGLTAQEIEAVAEVAIRGRWPDLTIILDMPTQTSMDRVLPKFSLFPEDPDAGLEKDRIERRPIEYHDQVRRNYLAQAKEDPKRYRVVNADRSPQDVHEDVWKLLGAIGR
jgi:dTMP kinase